MAIHLIFLASDLAASKPVKYDQRTGADSAVNIYRANDNWDEAIRVAKVYGGLSASKRVAYAWAMHLSG